jgi:hypothetical protein
MTLRDGKLKAVYKKGDKFCDAKKVKGKTTFTPIESQLENVIELVRNSFISTDQVPVVFNHKKYITFCPFWYFVV